MGITANGTHDDKLNDEGWISFDECLPPDHTDIYLKCQYMMDEFVCVGQMSHYLDPQNNTMHYQCLKQDMDEDILNRSGIKYWKYI